MIPDLLAGAEIASETVEADLDGYRAIAHRLDGSSVSRVVERINRSPRDQTLARKLHCYAMLEFPDQ